MTRSTLTFAALLFATPVHAWTWPAPGFRGNQPQQPPSISNPYNSPQVYDQNGQFRGNLNGNRFDPNSVTNPYGRYGSPYSSESLNNPYGQNRGFGAPVLIVPRPW